MQFNWNRIRALCQFQKSALVTVMIKVVLGVAQYTNTMWCRSSLDPPNCSLLMMLAHCSIETECWHQELSVIDHKKIGAACWHRDCNPRSHWFRRSNTSKVTSQNLEGKIVESIWTNFATEIHIRNVDVNKTLPIEHQGSLVAYSCSCRRMEFRQLIHK
jgi:hypothetical protein